VEQQRRTAESPSTRTHYCCEDSRQKSRRCRRAKRPSM